MAAILGLDDTTVEEMVADLDLPDDLWIGNFNCPGQVVVSGTAEGIAMASAEAKRRKAKRVLKLELTNPVRWSKCIKTIEEQGVSAYIEVGTGDVLTALNRKLNVKAETISLDSVSALDKLSQLK
mmetsp:Transcript_13551/g.22313  ORF Transcript_13551/g.22313 Transcript_13551/m.22313 type:complete len:125 (+) Transcript_13551:4140-4514(+)